MARPNFSSIPHRFTHVPPRAAQRSPSPDLRRLERKRRLASRIPKGWHLPADFLLRFTECSFRLENLSISPPDAQFALSRSADRRGLRPPQILRIRNHLAILRWIERAVLHRLELKLPAVLRWYTSISCGLSIATVDLSRVDRLEQAIRRINSPQLRLLPAMQEIAATHVQLLADPIFPGFNGILARLLLQYHLGRCQLPPVVLDPETDRPCLRSPTTLLPRLAELIERSYDALLVKPRNGG